MIEAETGERIANLHQATSFSMDTPLWPNARVPHSTRLAGRGQAAEEVTNANVSNRRAAAIRRARVGGGHRPTAALRPDARKQPVSGAVDPIADGEPARPVYFLSQAKQFRYSMRPQ